MPLLCYEEQIHRCSDQCNACPCLAPLLESVALRRALPPASTRCHCASSQCILSPALAVPCMRIGTIPRRFSSMRVVPYQATLCRCSSFLRPALRSFAVAQHCVSAPGRCGYQTSSQVNRPLPELRHWPRCLSTGLGRDFVFGFFVFPCRWCSTDMGIFSYRVTTTLPTEISPLSSSSRYVLIVVRAASFHIPPSASMKEIYRSLIRIKKSEAGCSIS